MTSELPPEALRLLETLFDSIEKLEIAGQLAEARSPLPVAELQARARLDPESVRAALADLIRAEVVEPSEPLESTVQLGPRARHADFEALMNLYIEDRPLVVAVLASSSMRRIRSMAAHLFSEAFVLGKKQEPR